jgi:predicted RNA-binding Zn-ribbon protein involved in translation (DUF1610 family)
MPIRFPCTACGQLLGIATRKVGTEINCPTCGLAVIVPDEEQAKLMRQSARHERKQSAYLTADTPPEISIPRESSEAFDGGLESFLTQLDVVPTASKPVTAPASIPPATKATASKASPAAISNPKPSLPGKKSNGTHPLPTRPTRPAATTALPAARSPVPASAVPESQSPSAASVAEIPFADEDHEVSVLSAADLLELAEEPLPQPAPARSATVAAPPPKKIPPPAKPAVVSPSKLPAVFAKAAAEPGTKASPTPPEAKPTPPPAQIVPPAPAEAPESAPLIEVSSSAASDFGFDFSAPSAANIKSQKPELAPAPTAIANPAPVAIPVAPFDNAVWISRRVLYTHVAILILVSIATFLIGWISGGAGARIPGSSHAGPVRFEANIQYVANGKTFPDEGAVVLLWPKQAKPLERLSSKRLAPSEPAPPADFPTLRALETLRGAYTRTNAQGEVRDLILKEPGEYYLLVISRNSARTAKGTTQ